MTRSLLKLMSLLLLVFAVLSLAACTWPEFKSSNPALVGFTEGCEDKPQPCWYGIQPGETTEDEAKITLTELGYSVEKTGSAIGEPLWIWETNRIKGFDCRVKMRTRGLRGGLPPEEIKTLVMGFALIDCENLYLVDLLLVIEKPIVAYNCGSEKVTFQDSWWLNEESIGEGLLESPVWLDDPIDNISVGFTDWIYWKLDTSPYYPMPRWMLHRKLWEKYCKYG